MRLAEVQFDGYLKSHNRDRSVSGYRATEASITWHVLLAVVEVERGGERMYYPITSVRSMRPIDERERLPDVSIKGEPKDEWPAGNACAKCLRSLTDLPDQWGHQLPAHRVNMCGGCYDEAFPVKWTTSEGAVSFTTHDEPTPEPDDDEPYVPLKDMGCAICKMPFTKRQMKAGQKTCSRKCGQALRRKRKT